GNPDFQATRGSGVPPASEGLPAVGRGVRGPGDGGGGPAGHAGGGAAVSWDDEPADWTPRVRYRTAYDLAYDLANFLRQLALPRSVQAWTLTTLRKELIKIGGKVVCDAKAVTFQLAEVAVPRALFAAILGRIGRLRAASSPG